MQPIVPHLWFDTQAKEAASFYVDIFGGDSAIIHSSVLHDTPSGDCDILSFKLRGYEFMAISAGPYFTINPSISFMLRFTPDQREQLDDVWNALSDGGSPLMPLGAYPFSAHYGWIQDRFGVSWQLMTTDVHAHDRPFIAPALMFTGDMCGKAEEAIDLYTSIFTDSSRDVTSRYPAGAEPDKEGTINYADFQLNGQWFSAMDSARAHDFSFNEGVSLLVRCKTQQEIDRFWSALSAVPEAEQCGWLKDKFGMSWQIAPKEMDEMMRTGTPDQIQRLTQAFLQMKKFDVAALNKAFKNA